MASHPRSQSIPLDGGTSIQPRVASNSSTEPSSRNSSVGPERPKQRGLHRVNFSVGGEDDNLDPPKKPLPTMQVPSATTEEPAGASHVDFSIDKDTSAMLAQDRARKLATRVGHYSAPTSRRSSFEDASASPYPVRTGDIPMIDLEKGNLGRPYSLLDDSTDDDLEDDETEIGGIGHVDGKGDVIGTGGEARRLVRIMTDRLNLQRTRGHRAGDETPLEEQDPYDDNPQGREYKAGILSSLLKLYDQQGVGSALRNSMSSPVPQHKQHEPEIGESSKARAPSDTPRSSSLPSSGRSTPKRPEWWKSPTNSTTNLLASSGIMAAPGMPKALHRPANIRSKSGASLAEALHKLTHPRSTKQEPEAAQITLHITEVLSRHKYLLKLCRAFMLYGAPTHRLEAAMRTSARALQIQAQFLYIPGCMIVSFDDPDMHTTEVKLVKENQGVDLGRLNEVYMIYKNMTHVQTTGATSEYGVEEAYGDLDKVMKSKPRYNVSWQILLYGCASLSVGPFAFNARPIDLPICFLLGCILGFLQLFVAPRSEQFSSVFEIAAAVVTSFLARAFGSIFRQGEPIFCFSAIAQSSIALILPGYTILCGALELQSHNITSGSVRMVYAIIYALMLGFGITIGTAMYGVFDRNAISSVTCGDSVWSMWNSNVFISHFPFVALFTICLILINQGSFRQLPVMTLVSFAGYQVNFWSSIRFANNIQIANALGAFAIGCFSNLYSRLFHGLAAATMLPAIFVQVPSGLAASGSLVAGVTVADQITRDAGGVSVITNGTQGFLNAQNGTDSSQAVYSGTVFNVGYGMVQVAIGISVGLFLSGLVVYPLGKRPSARSTLFSF